MLARVRINATCDAVEARPASRASVLVKTVITIYDAFLWVAAGEVAEGTSDRQRPRPAHGARDEAA